MFVYFFYFLFFFSSRRRHTRSYGDWSSDVCSSDLGTHVIMTVEILKMLQVENLTISGRAGHTHFAYRQSFYFNRIVFAFVGQRAGPPVDTNSKSERTPAQPQRCVWLGFVMMSSGLRESCHHSDDKQQ